MIPDRRTSPATGSLLGFLIIVFYAAIAQAQSFGPIPLEKTKVLSGIQTIKAPNGFRIFDSQGKLVKSVNEGGEVNAKAYVEHEGTLFLMSDWSYERYRDESISPNWMVVPGVTVKGNSTPPPSTNSRASSTAAAPALEFYEIRFPDSSDAQAPHLSYVDSSQLIYADDEWVVAGKFVRDQSAQGFHSLKVYRANTLRLAFELKLINYVFCMDWSKERQQFLAVTTSHLGDEMLVKWPEEEPAIVLIDVPKKQLSRVEYGVSSTDVVRWKGTQIEIEYTGEAPSPGEQTRFAGGAFSDVSINARRSSRGVPSLEKRREAYKEEAALQFVNLTNFSSEHHTWYSKVAMDLASPDGKELRVVRTTDFGHALDVNLDELRSRTVGNGLDPITDLRLLKDGTIAYSQEPSTVRFDGPGGLSEVDLSSSWDEEAKFGFTDSAAVLVHQSSPGSTRLVGKRIEPNGDVSAFPVNVTIKDEYPNWTAYPERESIARVFYDDREEEQVWREYSWETGRQIGDTFVVTSAKGMGAGGRKFGRSEGSWTITASLIDGHTGGFTYSVIAENQSNGREVEIGGEEISGDDPLELFNLNSQGFNVLCAGNHKIYFFRHDLGNNRTTKIREWDKNPGHGEAAFDRDGKRLFVPRESGYEVFSLAQNGANKVFDFYFHGRNQYAIVLPDGYYAGSPGCENFLSLRLLQKSIAAKVVAPWRNRPARVLETLGGEAEEISALERATERWLNRSGFGQGTEPSVADLPSVRLTSEAPLKTNRNEIELQLAIHSGASSPKNLKVSVNGVVSGETSSVSAMAPDEKRNATVPLTLSSGQNWIEVDLVDEAGRSSEPLRFRMICERPPEKTTRYIVALGVSLYANPALNLDLAAKDAEDVAAMLAGLGGVSETKSLVLTDNKVTKNSVAEIESFLSSAKENDEVIFFGAAHGVLDENLEYVFCSHEFDPADASGTGIRMESIIGAVRKGKSRKCLILLDTCQAGAVGEREAQLLAKNQGPALEATTISRSPITTIETGLSVVETRRYIEEMFLLPGSLEGIHVIGASSAAGFALEIDGILNGVFTSALIEGLRQGLGDRNGDGSVGVEELKVYLNQRVSELTNGNQRPSIVASEDDQIMSFPVK